MRFVVLICILLIPIVSADVNVSMSLESQDLNYSNSTNLSINIDPDGETIAGMQFEVRADNDKILIVNVTEGAFYTTNNTKGWFWNGRSNRKYGYSGYVFMAALGQNTTSIPNSFAHLELKGVGGGLANITIGNVKVSSPMGLPVNYSIYNPTVQLNVSHSGTKTILNASAIINSGRVKPIRNLYYINPVSGFKVVYNISSDANETVTIQPNTWVYSDDPIEKSRSW